MNQGNIKYVTFSIFKKYPEIVAAVSTRSYGTMKKDHKIITKNAKEFLSDCGLEFEDTVFMRQIGSSSVGAITSSTNNLIQGTDGLITKKKRINLAVVTADCLPIIFYEPIKKIVAVVHVGYKGLLVGILNEIIVKIKHMGGDIHNLIVGIGPGIGVCCYNVSRSRIEKFENVFYNIYNFYEEKNGYYCLNLLEIVKQYLLINGVKLINIESFKQCTKDSLDKFYSYRGEGTGKYGVFATVIGMK